MDESDDLGGVRALWARAWPVDPPREPHYPIGRASSPALFGIGLAPRLINRPSTSMGATRHSPSLMISLSDSLTGGCHECLAVYKLHNVRKQDLAPLAEQL